MYREPVRGDLNQPLYLNYRGTSGGIGWNLKGVEGALAVVSQTGKGRAQIIVDSPETQNVVAKTTTYLISGNVPLK
jgi:hypothetical protein